MALEPGIPALEAEAEVEESTTAAQPPTHLRQQCLDLLAEIDEFQSLLARTIRNPQQVELRQFRSSVTSELKMLQKLEQQLQSAAADGDEAVTDPEIEIRLTHALRSSNLPFYQAVWDIAKGTCAGLAVLGKRFYWDGETKASADNKKKAWDREKQPNKDKRKSVFVDIVADDGAEWVKVSTISESRLLFEMAKKGWERDSEDECLSDDEEGGKTRRTVLRNFEGEEPEDDDELELIKLVRDLRKAADATRLRYKHPRLRVELPKIEEGNVPEVDDIIHEMRSYGVHVECRGKLQMDTDPARISRLLPQPFRGFTPTLNVDCTLLLAMVSDLSHIEDIPPSAGFHRALLRQIEVEKQQPLLPTELWPAIGEHELVCTQEAATRMREIVQTIGTETEKTRMGIMMGDVKNGQLNQESLIGKFQELSDHRVPVGWKIPVRVIDAHPVIEAAKAEGKLPPWPKKLQKVYRTSIIIEVTIENSRHGDEDLEGPPVWICDTARSLAGKDKDRKA
ncbi:hypothetical protein N7512_008424 [Penicillium capsulatum]|nr:hypothetical protein N7512_008424 [Penicillium capsulatum]